MNLENPESDGPPAQLDAQHKIINRGILDRPQTRAIVLFVPLSIISFFLLRIQWEVPVHESGVFLKVGLPPPQVPPPLPPPMPTAGGSGAALLDAVSQATVPTVATVPTANFNLKIASPGFSLDGALKGFGPGGGGEGLGSGLGNQLAGLLFVLPRGPNGVCPQNSRCIQYVGLTDTNLHLCKIKVRGLVEQATYRGGTTTGYLCTGGTPDTGPFNVYRLTVSDPPQTFYLNAGRSGIDALFALNYTFDIWIHGGSSLTLFADSIDQREIANHGMVSIPDDDWRRPIMVKQPYDGQFIQIDAIEIK